MREQTPQRPDKAATTGHNQRPYCTAILNPDEARERLKALGFEHADSLPLSGGGRIPARGKGPNNTSAAVQWTDDRQALHWHDFTTDDHGTIFADRPPAYNRADAVRLFNEAEQKRRKAEADRLALQQRTARQAQDMYRAGEVTGTHRYITIKQLSGLHKARIDAGTGALLIPMWVSGVGLVNLQRIYPDGTKRFLKGGRVTGAYSVIGSLNNANRVLVCEGWATGATLAQLHGLPVVVAFNAGNLMPVCQAQRSRFENLAVVVAGDDDRQNNVNTGRQKAIEAAEAVGGTLLFPELCRCCTCSDHNDSTVCAWRRRNG